MRKYPESLPDGRKLFEEKMEFFFATEGSDPIDVAIREHLIAREGVVPVRVRLTEGEVPKGTLGVIEGVFGKADIINRNRRLYSTPAYEGAVGRAQTLVQAGNFLGEVDHPDFATLAGGAFRYTKVWMDADLGKFEAVILDTAGGRHLKGLLDGGVGVQISTRGYASSKVEKRNVGGVEIPVHIIGEDLTFEGIDAVLFASNIFGRVSNATTESAAGADDTTNEEERMTLAELREKYAALVAEIESAAREGYVATADVDAKISEAKESAKAEALESAEVTSRATALSAILEAVKPFLPEAAAATADVQESEAQKNAKALSEQVEALNTQVAALVAERAEAEQAKQDAEAKVERTQAIAEKVDALLAGFPEADLVKPALLKAESVEQAERLFEEQKALIEAAAARAKVKSKSGQRETGADVRRPETESLSAEERRERRIAGLDA